MQIRGFSFLCVHFLVLSWFGLSIASDDIGGNRKLSSEQVRLLVDEKNAAIKIQSAHERLNLSLTVKLNDKAYTIESIEDQFKGKDWFEVRGWLSQRAKLAYILRFALLSDNAFMHIYATVIDKHQNNDTDAQWHKYWQSRKVSHFQIGFVSDKAWRDHEYGQYNALAGGGINDPKITIQTGHSNPRWLFDKVADGGLRIKNYADTKGTNVVSIKPRRSGEFELTLAQDPLLTPYPAAGKIKVVVKAKDQTKTLFIDQGQDTNRLGTFKLNAGSEIKLFATAAESGDIMVFQSLHLKNLKTNQQDAIVIKRVDDVLYTDEYRQIAVKDFWQNHPIQSFVEKNAFYIQGVLEPTVFAGGASISLDTVIGVGNNSEKSVRPMLSILPKAKAYPAWWHPIDGVKKMAPGFEKLLAKTSSIVIDNDIRTNNTGWKDWGDYQISTGYISKKGDAIENWGALQYDLTTGLLNAYIKTGDTLIWQRARAAIRNVMNIQVAKFSPYAPKRSGAGIRKGGCTVSYSHWCQEPIPEFNYHARALLLYAHLTGERWPKDIAQMVIDNSAFFARSRTRWLRKSDRALAWTLKNLYYGVKVFSNGTQYNDHWEVGYAQLKKNTPYQLLLNELVDKVVSDIESNGKLRGSQPVWQGQIIDGLIMAFESGVLSKQLKKRTRAAMIKAMHYFIEQELRSKDDGYEMVYYRDGKKLQWRSAENYAWFWLSAIAYTGELTNNPDWQRLAKKMYQWLAKSFMEKSKFHSPRSWSGLLAFPEYYHHLSGQ